MDMDIGGGYAAVFQCGSRRLRSLVSTSESTKHGSKTADLVQILAVPRDTDNLKVLFTGCNPVGLIPFSTSLQCSVETASMLGEGGVVGLKPIIAGGAGFFEREVVVVLFFQGRA